MCLSVPPSRDLVGQWAMSALWEHEEKDRLLCIVMSPTDSQLLDFAVKVATLWMLICSFREDRT